MVSTRIVPLLIILSFSIWSIFIFVSQKAFYKAHRFDKKLFYAGVFLVAVLIIYSFNILHYIPRLFLYSEIFDAIAIGALVLTVIYLYIFNSEIISQRYMFFRFIFYLISLFVSLFFAYYLHWSVVLSLHIFFNLFLIIEIVSLLWYRVRDKRIVPEFTLMLTTHIILIIVNTLDVMWENVSLLYGVGVLCITYPFYFMIKYRQINLEIKDKIVFLNEIMKKERESFSSSINLIINMLESKNAYLKGHSENVSMIATLIGAHLGLSADSLEELQTAAMLSDIGYVGIPMEEYSHKKIINYEDYEKIKRHPLIGAEILKKSTTFSSYSDYVLLSHECWDGTGYPFGLKEKNIPLFSRIIQIADSYAALISDRFYRSALSPEDALLIIKAGKGKEFDPELVDIFSKCIRWSKT